MEIITGYTSENHVTSADDASLYRGILGQGDYVLEAGNKFSATIIDNNTVRIMDGDLLIQGHQARIRANNYNEITIDNGTPGQKRNDLIVARYVKNTTTGIESITLEVVKGTPGETAIDPETIQGDLTVGDNQRDFVLYRASINGLALESVTSQFSTIPNLTDLETEFSSHKAETAEKHIHSSGSNDFGYWVRFDDGTQICWTTRYNGVIDVDSSGFQNSEISGLTYRDFSFNPPVSFIGNGDSFVISPWLIRASGAVETSFVSNRGGANVNNRITVYRGSSGDTTYRLMYKAIGRWK